MVERIGSCHIVGEVASGGMAVVYRATQDHLQRTVAIKALKPSIASNEQLVRRFEREAISLAQLQHENIIHIYEFYRQDGDFYIVMEYVEGLDLYDLMESCEIVPFDVAAIIALQVARALDYIHYRNIIHRDIKPANIMISKNGGIKVMDFGIARDRHFDDDLTQAGMGIGTPAYMSPEQIHGDKLNAASDIFSLGIVLYQMATGRKPFVEDNIHTVMQKIRKDPHPKPRKINPAIPRALERIIEKCLQKEPESRYQSAQHLVMALERFLSKHVEMNYHARLVLFQKNNEIIDEEEAKKYLEPQGRGRRPSELSEASFPVKRQIRRVFSVQGAILAITALVTGVIHLAPVGATVPAANIEITKGYVRIVANPWGEVFIDGNSSAMTPLASPQALAIGEHTLKIKNPFCDSSERSITVLRNSPDNAPIERFDLVCKGSTP